MTQKDDTAIIKKLRKDLKKQLNLTKYLFFNSEYAEIKHILKQNDDAFLSYIMKKELNHYLKSIVICTTGPIEICNALFNNYIVNSNEVAATIQDYSFSHYNLQKYFKSPNSIPLHENLLRMLKFVGVREGVLNDSSWLESGRLLQEERVQKLELQKQNLASNLPKMLSEIKNSLQQQKANARRQTQIEILEEALLCFELDTNEFDVDQFKIVSMKIHSRWNTILYRRTHKLIRHLANLSHNAVIFGLTQNRKIKF